MKEKQVQPTLEHHGQWTARLLAFDNLTSDPILHLLWYTHLPPNAGREKSARTGAFRVASSTRSLRCYLLKDRVSVTGISINCDFPEAMAASTIPLISALDVTCCAVTPIDLARYWKLTCGS
jgi:hypothetical protein